MSNLSIVRHELNRQYFNTKNTIERFKILNEVEEMIKELRQTTIDNLDKLEQEIIEQEEVVLSETQKEVLERIQTIVSEVTGTRYELVHKAVVPGANVLDLYEELVFDSLDLVELVMALEDEFSIEISDEQAEQFKNIQEIINLVTK